MVAGIRNIHAPKMGIDFDDPVRDKKYVSEMTLKILIECMSRSGIAYIKIGSTYRNPYDQARVLYKEIYGQAGEKQYKKMGQEVLMAGHITETNALVNQIISANKMLASGGKDQFKKIDLPSEIRIAMQKKIEFLESNYGRGCCSKHQLDPKTYNVFDIYPSSIPQRMLNFIEELTRHPIVSGIGLPEGYKKTNAKHFHESKSCLHVEIPQGTQGETPPLQKNTIVIA